MQISPRGLREVKRCELVLALRTERGCSITVGKESNSGDGQGGKEGRLDLRPEQPYGVCEHASLARKKSISCRIQVSWIDGFSYELANIAARYKFSMQPLTSFGTSS